jgi:hypothetical protein
MKRASVSIVYAVRAALHHRRHRHHTKGVATSMTLPLLSARPARTLRPAIGTLLVLFYAVTVFAQGNPKPDLEGINLQVRSAVSGRPMIGIRQTDWRWAGVMVGPWEKLTMGAAGCQLASIAMIANYYGLVSQFITVVPYWDPLLTNPASLHAMVRDNKHYTAMTFCDMCIDYENAFSDAFFDPGLSIVGLKITSHGAWNDGEAATVNAADATHS